MIKSALHPFRWFPVRRETTTWYEDRINPAHGGYDTVEVLGRLCRMQEVSPVQKSSSSGRAR